MDREIELAPGDRAAFAEQKLDVEFVRVVEDSRCPTDVTCIVAGEVKVLLSTRLDAAKAEQHEIVAGQSAPVGTLQLDVTKVQPERVTTHEIKPEEYRITLKLSQAAH